MKPSRIAFVFAAMMLIIFGNYSAEADFDSCVKNCVAKCNRFATENCLRDCKKKCLNRGDIGSASVDGQLNGGERLRDGNIRVVN